MFTRFIDQYFFRKWRCVRLNRDYRKTTIKKTLKCQMLRSWLKTNNNECLYQSLNLQIAGNGTTSKCSNGLGFNFHKVELRRYENICDIILGEGHLKAGIHLSIVKTFYPRLPSTKRRSAVKHGLAMDKAGHLFCMFNLPQHIRAPASYNIELFSLANGADRYVLRLNRLPFINDYWSLVKSKILHLVFAML